MSVKTFDDHVWFIFDNEAGERWAVNGRTGKGIEYGRSTVTREIIEQAVRGAGAFKGDRRADAKKR